MPPTATDLSGGTMEAGPSVVDVAPVGISKAEQLKVTYKPAPMPNAQGRLMSSTEFKTFLSNQAPAKAGIMRHGDVSETLDAAPRDHRPAFRPSGPEIRGEGNEVVLSKSFGVPITSEELAHRQEILAPVRQLQAEEKYEASYNVKYKAMLGEMQEAREKVYLEKVDAIAKHDRMLAEFKQQQAERRASIRNNTGEPEETAHTAPTGTGHQSAEAAELLSNKALEDHMRLSKAALPPWARTEEANQEAEEEELDSLLEFAQTLDFDAYIEDMEVQETLQTLKRRIRHLGGEQKTLEAQGRRVEREQILEELRAARAADADGGSTGTGPALAGSPKTDLEGPALASPPPHAEMPEVFSPVSDVQHGLLATRLVAENREIAKMHSLASMARVMETAKSLGIADARPEPCVADNTCKRFLVTRLEERGDTSALPYMYRHPGV